MATPPGAEHNDLQQRFKNLERKARELAAGLQGRATTVTSATTAQFASAVSDVNTLDKAAGCQAWNTTTRRPVWPVGPAATDAWVDATGATVHTPS